MEIHDKLQLYNPLFIFRNLVEGLFYNYSTLEKMNAIHAHIKCTGT